MIFVTGVTGFVGRNLLKRLTGQGGRIRCLVRDKNRMDNCDGVEVIEGDILNKDLLCKALQGVDVAIHLAAVAKSSDPKELVSVNVEGTRNLIDACKENRVKRVIYISSLDAGLNGTNRYGETKAIGEDIVRNSEIEYVILRPALIYGGDSKDFKMLTDLIRRYPLIPVMGNGKGRLQPIYINDVCDVIIKVLQSDMKNKTYYIAGEESVSLDGLIDKIAAIFSKRIAKIHIPLGLLRLPIKLHNLIVRNSLLSYESFRLLERDKVCDIKGAREDLGFKPTSLDNGLKLTLGMA